MSYILDALKKSDQQRQRGATPTLQAAQVTVAAPKRPVVFYYSTLVVVLIGVGVAIGWWGPWQTETATVMVEPVAAALPESVSSQNAPPPRTTNAAPVKTAQVPLPTVRKVVSLNELPSEVQREIPGLVIQLHAYSSNPAERLVSINSIRLREGGSLMLGLRLEEITPDGMIFSYKGYRFKHGTR